MKNFSLILLMMFMGALAYAQEPEMHQEVKQDQQAISELAGEQILQSTRGGKFFYTRGCIGEHPGKVFYRPSEDGAEKILFDPLIYRNDAFYTVHGLFPNPDGTRLAIALSASHLHDMEVLVVDLEGNLLDQDLEGITGYALSWLPDGEHFLYHRLAPNRTNDEALYKNSKTWLHKVGTTQGDDIEYFSARTASALEMTAEDIPLAEFNVALNAVVGKIILPDNTMRIFMRPGDPLEDAPWVKLAQAEARVTDVFFTDRFIYYKSAKDARNYKIMASNVRWPDFCNADVAVPEFDDQRITDFLVNSDGIFFLTIDDHSKHSLWFKERSVNMYNPTARHHFRQIELPVDAKAAFLQTDHTGQNKLWVNVTDKNSVDHRFRYVKNGKFIKETVNTNSNKAL